MSLADLLLSTLKRKIASLEMVPSKGGCFEVDVDGERVYSKLKSGQFPDESDVLRLVQLRAPA
ncbi:MAG: Rdx family protein [Planctomycetes bacterium]|nr:Rdx family protein [Planctomycetota bacterium]